MKLIELPMELWEKWCFINPARCGKCEPRPLAILLGNNRNWWRKARAWAKVHSRAIGYVVIPTKPIEVLRIDQHGKLVERVVDELHPMEEGWSIHQYSGGWNFAWIKEGEAEGIMGCEVEKLSENQQMSSEMSNLGDRIRAKHIQHRMTQRELADQIGVDPSSIRNYEKGRNTPR